MAERRHPNPALTLVPRPATGDPRKNAIGEDWSRLMARAQDGDRQAYRRLLDGITPYIRSLAGRCFRQPTDVDDAVQDVLLTASMWCVTPTIRCAHSVHGSLPLPLAASLTGYAATRAEKRARWNFRPTMKPLLTLQRTLVVAHRMKRPLWRPLIDCLRISAKRLRC